MIAIGWVLAVLISSEKAKGHPPAWLDNMLAGYALKYDETHGVIGVSDPKTGFFIVRTVECDGGVITLTLTKDRHYVADEGFRVPSLGNRDENSGNQPLVVKPLTALATGKGVRIGDTPGLVRTKLGKPTTVERTGNREQFLTWTYTWKSGTAVGDPTFEEVYTFKQSKLIEIIFSRLANDD